MLVSDAFAIVAIVAIVAITLTPGSHVLLLMVRAVGNDMRGAIGFSIGVALGDVVIIAAICLRLGVWLQ